MTETDDYAENKVLIQNVRGIVNQANANFLYAESPKLERCLNRLVIFTCTGNNM